MRLKVEVQHRPCKQKKTRRFMNTKSLIDYVAMAMQFEHWNDEISCCALQRDLNLSLNLSTKICDIIPAHDVSKPGHQGRQINSCYTK